MTTIRGDITDIYPAEQSLGHYRTHGAGHVTMVGRGGEPVDVEHRRVSQEGAGSKVFVA